MSESFPDWISLRARHDDGVPATDLIVAYASALREAGRGDADRYSLSGMEAEWARGDDRVATQAISRMSHEQAGFFMLATPDDTTLVASRGTGGVPYWDVEIRYPSETRPRTEWVAAMAKLAPHVVSMPGFVRVAIYRHSFGATAFVPDPPIAAQNHLVSTTDAEIAESYDDPAVFWENWQTIDEVGGFKICTRALGELDEHSWLAFTYEGTMAMARAAKPNKTRYKPARWMPEFAAWWEPGDYDDEKGGNPALRVAGYQASTKTLEMTGFIVDKPLTNGGNEPRHVLIKEIYTVRGLVRRKQDAEGRPIETVRVVFPDAWMARQERRPLLDAGAKVFYMDRKTGDLVEITD